MQHTHIELKEADPVEPDQIVTKALADFQQAVEDRLKAVEAKSADNAALVGRLDKIEAKVSRPFVANAPSIVTPDENVERKAFVNYLRSGRVEEKTLAYAPPSTGGILAPDQTAKTIIERIAEFSPVRGFASTISMSGPLLQLPRLVNEVQVGEVGETDDRPESEPSFEQIDLKPFEMAVIVPVTRVLLEDSQIDLEAYIAAHVARRFGQKEAGWFVKGNGTTQAEGVMNSDEIGTVEAGTDAVTATDIIDTFYAIASGYSSTGSWLMNRSTMAAVRKLTDAQGSYLWQASIAAGTPPTLMGRPVYEAVDMDGPDAGKSPIIFGDFASGYLIGDRVGISTLRDEYTGASNGIVKFHVRRRVGGRVVLGEALTKLTLKA
ncbi:phage major capsid protein [Pararhizobium mangrovi]|uniref:phage major capsid protein n=1 Tax=Pararhizobium mangrovi TaxID=2590452 RepID=UPI001AEDABE7|nr:phage major capsid protein [Pararhizobium mangrovi]